MKVNREKFSPEELAACLGHYDLGKIEGMRELPRGSHRAPKLVIQSQKGKFLLKRRISGRDDPTKVAFTHQLQLYLAERSFPLPHLVGTRDDNNSMLVLDNNVYEMFEFIDGEGYDGSLDATFHSGQILGLYHKLLKGFRGDYQPPTGSYHNAHAIHHAIRNTIGSLPIETRPPREVLTQTVSNLEKTYKHCCRQADALGLRKWDSQIVHGDWHPGNMLFRDRHVVAVLDYDAARLQQRVIDFANGALQFSIIGGSEDPSRWPDYLDGKRFKQFMRGYDSVNAISADELKAAPYLMCEAMIAESVLPIAATGSFGQLEGFAFLQMIDRKIQWILAHIDELGAVLQ